MLNNIQDLLLLQQAKESVDPYHEVLESIRFDGTQYFDTGVLGDRNTTIEAGIFLTSMPSVESEGNYYIFGSRSGSATANNIDCIWSWQSGLVCDFNNSAYATYRLAVSKTNLALNTVYDVVVNKNKREVLRAGVSLGSNTTANADTFTSTNTICIGLVNGANISSYVGFNGGLKYFKINDDDYVPVLDSQMRPCLYNKTTKTFLYAKKISDGSTTYDLGFKRWNKYDVDYIESSGTQYIDTGYTFADDFAYEIEYEGLNNGECLIGGRTSSVRTAILYRAMATQVDGQTTVPIAGLNATQTPFKLGVLSNTKHKVKVAIANNKGNVWVDDTQVYTNQAFTGTYISGKTTAIFADHFGDQTGASEYQEYATSKLYALKFWQGTTLVRDYKPSVWHNGNTTAVACLYDEVYNKMYTNAGTGSFKAYIIGANDTIYEVGSNCFVSPTTATQQVTNNYFNSGMYGNEEWNVKLISFTSTNVAGQLFGNFIGSSVTNNLTINSGTATGTGTISRFDGQAMSQDKIINMGANTKSLLQINKIGAWQDSTQIIAWSNPNSFTTTGTCYICGTNGSATVRPNGCCYLLIEENNVPIAEFIPVRNKTVTSEYGLYDRVSGTLNTGIGTITFNALT